MNSILGAALWLGVLTVAGGLPERAAAHEIHPTMVDMIISPQSVTLIMRFDAEAMLAGGPGGRAQGAAAGADTGGGAARDMPAYEDLRGMPSDHVEDLFRERWSYIATLMPLRTASGKEVPLRLDQIAISEVQSPNDPRPARALIHGKFPERTEGFQISWSKGLGTLMLLEVRPPVKETPAGYQLSPSLSRNTSVAVAAGMGPAADKAYSAVLRGGDETALIPVRSPPPEATPLQVVGDFIPIGVEHIIPYGPDHVLFILGIFFLSARLSVLAWQVAAFTLAHSMSLAMSTFGVIDLPASVIEPLIALSIVFVAAENILVPQMNMFRFMVIFGFGLLHGLGFGAVIESYGVPPDRMVAALAGFNIGVELGQLAVLAIAFGLVGYWFRHKPWYRSRIAVPASAMIAAIGLIWFFEIAFISPV